MLNYSGYFEINCKNMHPMIVADSDSQRTFLPLPQGCMASQKIEVKMLY